MRRRITQAMVASTAFVLLLLGIPLAIVAQRWTLDSELVELQEQAAQTLAGITTPLDPSQLSRLRPGRGAAPHFGIYLTSGERWFGTGPVVGDEWVERASSGHPATSNEGVLIVATPITDQSDTIVGVLRVEESRDGANQRALGVWLVMALASAAALAVAWLLARRVAYRLSRPVVDLAATATALGSGAVLPVPVVTGIAEIDMVGRALAASSLSVNDALVRERRFSADVSHQLRTPLAGVQLRLEAAATNPTREAIEKALDDLARLEQTVVHLMAHARDAVPSTSLTRLDLGASRAVERWSDRATTVRREIVATIAGPSTTRGADASVDQVLDALIDNALRHGIGTIHVVQRRVAGGAAIDVADEGTLTATDDVDQIFQRGHGVGTGSGLALARSIAEAGGGRLVVTNRAPTTFTLFAISETSTPEPAVG